jgi:hypothetical protein
MTTETNADFPEKPETVELGVLEAETDPTVEAVETFTDDDVAALDEAIERVEKFDANDDGRVSALETIRAELSRLDDRLEAQAEAGGLLGKLAGGAHLIIDAIDLDPRDLPQRDDTLDDTTSDPS